MFKTNFDNHWLFECEYFNHLIKKFRWQFFFLKIYNNFDFSFRFFVYFYKRRFCVFILADRFQQRHMKNIVYFKQQKWKFKFINHFIDWFDDDVKIVVFIIQFLRKSNETNVFCIKIHFVFFIERNVDFFLL